MTLPTVSVEDFLARFPEFEEAGEDRVALALIEAGAYVSDEWAVEYLPMAIMLLAAHFLYAELIMSSRMERDIAGVSVGGPIKEKKIGPLSITYATSTSASSNQSGIGGSIPLDVSDSPYGVRFIQLVKINFPPALVVI